MTYSLLQLRRPISALGCWVPHLAAFTHVVGYSGIGHFFLLGEETSEYAVLHPFRQAYKSYGRFESVATFEGGILSDPVFAEHVLRPGHQAAIRKLLGPLEAEEVYIPRPYPFLGGSEEPHTYMKGNVWVFAEIVGQSHGYR
jgi:hypothetical protein